MSWLSGSYSLPQNGHGLTSSLIHVPIAPGRVICVLPPDIFHSTSIQTMPQTPTRMANVLGCTPILHSYMLLFRRGDGLVRFLRRIKLASYPKWKHWLVVWVDRCFDVDERRENRVVDAEPPIEPPPARIHIHAFAIVCI